MLLPRESLDTSHMYMYIPLLKEGKKQTCLAPFIVLLQDSIHVYCLLNAVSVTQSAEGTPHSSWGILKSPDKVNKLKEQNPSPAGKNDTLRCSRVSFRPENEVFGGDDGEEHEIEARADREVEAITGIGGESPGVDDKVKNVVAVSRRFFSLAGLLNTFL